MSKNSWLVGTTGISFHWVFIFAAAWEAVVVALQKVANESFGQSIPCGAAGATRGLS